MTPRPIRRRPTRFAARAAVAALACVLPALAAAQSPASGGVEEYRKMLEDGNPAELFEAKGEALWKQPRGPKNASLERCDLGLGPGVVKGAWAQLPRWFPDTGRVQDVESRLLTCMSSLQGFDEATLISTPFNQGEKANLVAIATWIAGQSRGMRIAVPQSRPEEQRMYELGKRAFFYHGGPMDFACATCHGAEGKRIRMQDLPDLRGNPGDGVGFAAWPAYRVSNGEMWSMQMRLNDCFRQQRFPYPGYASEATIALGVYMGVNARGAVAAVPALKR